MIKKAATPGQGLLPLRDHRGRRCLVAAVCLGQPAQAFAQSLIKGLFSETPIVGSRHPEAHKVGPGSEKRLRIRYRRGFYSLTRE